MIHNFTYDGVKSLSEQAFGVYRDFHVFTDVHVVHSRGLTLTTRVKFKTLWASQLIIINCSLKKKKKSSLLIEAIFRILWTHC